MTDEPVKQGPGRPAYEPKKADREKVAILASGGMTQTEIAAALKISAPTLCKHFAWELTEGAAVKTAERIQAMHRQAKKGSVPAARFLDARASVRPPQHAPHHEAAVDDPKPADLGKKARANAEAHVAHRGNPWGDILN